MESLEGLSSYAEGVYEVTDKCPVCGNRTLTIRGVVYNTPYFGRLLLEVMNCSTCGFRYMDITYLDSKGPVKLTYRVTDRVDVERTWVIRSAEAKVYSPDLGFTLAPGSAGEAMITPLEGLIYRLIQYAEAMRGLEGEAEARRLAFIREANEALNGFREFTLIIEDPTGNSIIKPPPGREGRLKEDRLEVPQG
ncbi:ZPR1 zinc finger domain-containing protein [Caldivirga maquilingensis]|uniref:ZPR1-related zinc finger protein n=1 Tax=Caldivirga maquilingensis (strain ATCC 700844 / DSM 13496 / JCM 10307 / IC-167) TaxID=397948 RepID=A8MBX7_CALMQ|nr:ZPR1 zinc finger domain-containing protein [Caldivirga maquilingensis]ABW01320.1 ZPR1-related zinc finger protein [Caldivirga maquilingensis IC-167]